MDIKEYLRQKYGLTDETSPILLAGTRDDLADLFKELGYKVGAEIGVDRGYYSETLCTHNPGVKLYCIDPWKVYRKYTDFDSQAVLDSNFRKATERLKPYGCEIIRKSSMGAIGDFKSEMLDFVYIDGNHAFNYVLEDLERWSEIVRPGGIVSGHDYTCFKHKNVGLDVKRAIETHLGRHNISPLYLWTKSRSSSWFYIK